MFARDLWGRGGPVAIVTRPDSTKPEIHIRGPDSASREALKRGLRNSLFAALMGGIFPWRRNLRCFDPMGAKKKGIMGANTPGLRRALSTCRDVCDQNTPGSPGVRSPDNEPERPPTEEEAKTE